MVVFVDLEDDVSDDPHADPSQPRGFSSLHRHHLGDNKVTTKVTANDDNDEPIEKRPNPNINSFSAALGAYPIVSQLAHNVDLNTLDALSRTCRQVRANLLQYRNRLVQQTLRCENECHDIKSVVVDGERPGPQWHILGEAGHLVSGKVSTCARDLVSDCRRCGRIVCRNCTCKPPSPSSLPSRHRRLCPTCLSSPLCLLLSSNSDSSPCACTSHIHLCSPCGASLATADTTYRRVWTWRTRYATSYGGLGIGIGEGNEGVKCARGKECAGAVDVEVEFECSSRGGGGGSRNGSNSSLSGGSDGGSGRGEIEGSESAWGEKDEAGYLWQEIEGLGGVVKKKVRKRERVGGTVREWEDEREGRDEVLGREKRGTERSWCGWCGRVVLGGRDLEEEGEEGEGEAVRSH